MTTVKCSFVAVLAGLLSVGCADQGANQVYQALCDEMGSTRGGLHGTALRRGLALTGDLDTLVAARADVLVEAEADRATRKNLCYAEIGAIRTEVLVDIKKLEFGAGLIAKGKQDWNYEGNPLADAQVKMAFDRADVAARVDCEAGDLKSALKKLAEATRAYDRVLLQAFDVCERIGWDRTGWEQASPDYQPAP